MKASGTFLAVLILVLVEHTLRVHLEPLTDFVPCLNPCFSGTYSQRLVRCKERALHGGLNPCFSGTYSQRTI